MNGHAIRQGSVTKGKTYIPPRLVKGVGPVMLGLEISGASRTVAKRRTIGPGRELKRTVNQE